MTCKKSHLIKMLPLTLSLNIEKNSMIKRCKGLTVRPKRECLAYRLH